MRTCSLCVQLNREVNIMKQLIHPNIGTPTAALGSVRALPRTRIVGAQQRSLGIVESRAASPDD